MNWFDTICLWTGYCICCLALLRAVIAAAFNTTRFIRHVWRSCERLLVYRTTKLPAMHTVDFAAVELAVATDLLAKQSKPSTHARHN